MGDRVVITLKSQALSEPLNIYLHWGGSHYKQTLAKALSFGESRWSDHSYFIRVIIGSFHDATKDKLLGMGISNLQQESEYPELIVDLDKECVFEGGKRVYTQSYHAEGEYTELTFEEFIRKNIDTTL